MGGTFQKSGKVRKSGSRAKRLVRGSIRIRLGFTQTPLSYFSSFYSCHMDVISILVVLIILLKLVIDNQIIKLLQQMPIKFGDYSSKYCIPSNMKEKKSKEQTRQRKRISRKLKKTN